MSTSTFHIEEIKTCPLTDFVPCMIVVQARMLSTRLAGKVMKRVLEKPLLHYLIERLRLVPCVEGICIATSHNPADDIIADFCNQEGVHAIRGSEEDVLSRYHAAAEAFGLEAIIRITSDCPLIDPEVIYKALCCFHQNYAAVDYLSNTLERTFPRGMCVEIFRTEALKKAFFEAKLASEREHVTPYIIKNSKVFRLASLVQAEDESSFRLTVDTPEDFSLIKKLLEELYPKNCQFLLKDIIHLLKKHPELAKLNAHVVQKTV